MKKYLIHADVNCARGSQTWEIEANSPEEAQELFMKGEGDILFEQFEADEYGALTVEEAR